jgi:threonyl-tRNA synthetase
LSPEQVRVLSVRDTHDDYAAEVVAELHRQGVRAEAEYATEPLGSRVRRAKLDKLPYVLVVGDDDVQRRTVGVNERGGDTPERGVPLDDFAKRLLEEIARHGSPESP